MLRNILILLATLFVGTYEISSRNHSHSAIVSKTPTQKTCSCHHDDNNFRCVKYVKNYDGDTVTFNIPSIHPFFGKNIPVRLGGIDTPEIRTKDSCEQKLATKAKQVVHDLLTNAKCIYLQNIERGKYFRIVADIIFDGKSLTRYLLDNKYGYPYSGNKKQKPNWCGFKP